MKSIFIALFGLLCVQQAQAEQALDTPVLTYQGLVARLSQHPSLIFKQEQAQSQRDSALGATSLPDPMIMLGVNNYPISGGGFDRSAMTSKSIGFVQKIPNKQGRNAVAAGQQYAADVTELELSYQRQQLRMALDKALADWQRLKQDRLLLQKEIKLLSQEKAYWVGQTDAGMSFLSEQHAIEARQAEINITLEMLKAEAEAVKATLFNLVGLELAHVPSVPDGRKPIIWQEGDRVYPIVIAAQKVQIARAAERKAQAAYLPDIQVSATYAQRDDGGRFDGGDFISAQVGVTLPFWSGKNQDPKRRAAAAARRQAEASAEATERYWQAERRQRWALLQENQAKQALLEQQQAALAAQEASLQTAYETTGNLIPVLKVSEKRLQLDRQKARLIASYTALVSQYNADFMPEIHP